MLHQTLGKGVLKDQWFSTLIGKFKWFVNIKVSELQFMSLLCSSFLCDRNTMFDGLLKSLTTELKLRRNICMVQSDTTQTLQE